MRTDTHLPHDKQNQRVQVCLDARNVSWLDLSLSNSWTQEQKDFLNSSGILTPSVPEISWTDYRGILDIDGSVNAWGLYWRIASGSVIFKVGNIDADWTNSYISKMVPWKHFVPINANLSNLLEVTRIVTSDDEAVIKQMQQIADNARALSKEYTYPKEVERVAKELNDIFSLPLHEEAAKATSAPVEAATATATGPKSTHTMADTVVYNQMVAWHQHISHVIAHRSSSSSQQQHTQKILHQRARAWNQSDFEMQFFVKVALIPPMACKGPAVAFSSSHASTSSPTSACPLYHNLTNFEALPLAVTNSFPQFNCSASLSSSSSFSSSSSSSSSSAAAATKPAKPIIAKNRFENFNCSAHDWQSADKRNVIIAWMHTCTVNNVSFLTKNLRAAGSGAELVIFCATSSSEASTTDTGRLKELVDSCGDVVLLDHSYDSSSSSSSSNNNNNNDYANMQSDVAMLMLSLRWLHRRMHRKNFCTRIMVIFQEATQVLFQRYVHA